MRELAKPKKQKKSTLKKFLSKKIRLEFRDDC